MKFACSFLYKLIFFPILYSALDKPNEDLTIGKYLIKVNFVIWTGGRSV